MTETLTKEKDLDIDKSDWKTIQFGDVVDEPRETINDFEEDDPFHVIGLEHIESEDIHIRSYDTTEESTSFTRLFREGDVLFGRRRAYLKKAAVVPFSGICSGDIIVMRAREEQLFPGLLPFIVNNDKFFDYAVKHSAGGLSPRVKFKDLAKYELQIPPKEKQTQLAELLWSLDKNIEQNHNLLGKLEVTLSAEIERQIHNVKLDSKTISEVLEEISSRQEVNTLNEMGEFFKGKGIRKSDVKKSGIPSIRYGEIYTNHDKIVRSFYSFIDKNTANKSFKLQKDDVIFASSGETIDEIGKSVSLTKDIEVYAGSDTIVFRPHNMNGVYLGYLMNSQIVRYQLNKYGTGATVAHVYISDLKKIKVPVYSIEEQESIAKKLEMKWNTIECLRYKNSTGKDLLSNLINQIF